MYEALFHWISVCLFLCKTKIYFITKSFFEKYGILRLSHTKFANLFIYIKKLRCTTFLNSMYGKVL